MHELRPYNRETHSHSGKALSQHPFYLFQPTDNMMSHKETLLDLTNAIPKKFLLSISAIGSDELAASHS